MFKIDSIGKPVRIGSVKIKYNDFLLGQCPKLTESSLMEKIFMSVNTAKPIWWGSVN